MKTAAEYAEQSHEWLDQIRADSDVRDVMAAAALAQANATLALAAATLEAAERTITAQASNLLSALEEPELGHTLLTTDDRETLVSACEGIAARTWDPSPAMKNFTARMFRRLLDAEATP